LELKLIHPCNGFRVIRLACCADTMQFSAAFVSILFMRNSSKPGRFLLKYTLHSRNCLLFSAQTWMNLTSRSNHLTCPSQAMPSAPSNTYFAADAGVNSNNLSLCHKAQKRNRQNCNHLWNGGATMGLCELCICALDDGRKISKLHYWYLLKLVEISGCVCRFMWLQMHHRLLIQF
jgi:hypothetical protein